MFTFFMQIIENNGGKLIAKATFSLTLDGKDTKTIICECFYTFQYKLKNEVKHQTHENDDNGGFD